MLLKRLTVVGAFFALSAAPAFALFCDDTRGSITTGFSFGDEELDIEDLNDFDLMELRRNGVDATRVERWNGCIRAFVRQRGGGEAMEFYDPNTFQRIY